MKKSIPLRKKYANGTNNKGVGPNNYIQDPSTTLADYNIMLAEADSEAMANPWLPIVGSLGAIAQSVVGSGALTGMANGKTIAPAVSANGNSGINKDTEVEGGEAFQTPDGQVGEFQGPSHEQGGIPLNAGEDIPEGTIVYSDRLKVAGKTMAERKAIRERQTANIEKSVAKGADLAMKNAAQRKMMVIQKEEQSDLQHQEMINNMQQMADTMVKAFGTGVAGLQGDTVQENGAGQTMKFFGGTGPNGIPVTYAKGYDESMFKDFYDKYNELNPGTANMGAVQGDIGIASNTPNFGKMFGPATFKASQDWLTANKDKKGDFGTVPDSVNPNIDYEALKNFSVTGINDNASLDYGDPYAKDGVNYVAPTNTVMKSAEDYGKGVTTPAKTPSRFDKYMSSPAIGDLTQFIGDYLGGTAGLKNAAESRSTDVAHENVYANAGKEAQKYLGEAKAGINAQKEQAILRTTSQGATGKKGARGTSRGVNQMRATDWLYDTALQSSIAEISAKAAEQLTALSSSQAQMSMNADQLKGQGEYQANMANEAAKDAYYTAKGLGLKDQASAVQVAGKNMNDMKQNEIIANIMKNYGSWVGIDGKGIMTNKTK